MTALTCLEDLLKECNSLVEWPRRSGSIGYARNRRTPAAGLCQLWSSSLLLVLLQLTRLGFLIRTTIPDRPRQRMFIASVSFLVTFVGVRVLVSLITHNVGPFQWVMVRGHHIHHLVWGILILLLVGYGWLLDLGRSHSPLSIFFSRLMSVSYGVGAALTLDEFALWLNLEPDAYWSREGRLSIDAVIFFRQPAGRGRMGRAVLPRIRS